MTLRFVGSALLALLVFPLLSSAQAQPTARSLPLRWSVVAPGVWKATAGTPERLTLLGTAGGTPRLDALARVGAAKLPFVMSDDLRATDPREGRAALSPRCAGAALRAGAQLQVAFSSVEASRRCTSIISAPLTTDARTRPCRSTSPVPVTACWSTRRATSRCTPGALSGPTRSTLPSCATATSIGAGRRSPLPMRSRCSFPLRERRSICSPGRRRSMRCAATTSTLAAECCRQSGGSASCTASRRCSPTEQALAEVEEFAKRALSARRARPRARVAERIVSRHLRVGQHSLPRSRPPSSTRSRAAACA